MTEMPPGPPADQQQTPQPTPTPEAKLTQRTRPRWLLPAAAVGLMVFLAWAVMLRRAPAPPVPDAAVSSPAAETAPPPLAETVGEEGHLSIAIVSLDRVAADTVELRLAVTNTSPAGAPALDISQRFSADGPDRGTLAEVYLADLTHERKLFVLRDAQNAPLGSRDATPLAAGERRVLWARYPAPRDRDMEVVGHVPHADPMPNVPVGQREATD